MSVDFEHCPEYRDVRTDGIVFFLTRNQATVVSIMHAEHRRGAIDIEGWWVLRKAGVFCTRMAEVFRFSPAWKRLIVPGKLRGCYNLAPFIKLENSPGVHRDTEIPRGFWRVIFQDFQGTRTLLASKTKRPKYVRPAFVEYPLPAISTHHAPCSVGKIDVMAQRRARGESLFHPGDFVPDEPVMIERYVFSGRMASKLGVAAARFITPELLPSSPRLT